MNKKILQLLITSGALLVAVNGSATELKTSSLTMAKTSTPSKEKIAQQCQTLFKEGDKLISEAAKQPGTHTQVRKMRDQLSSSKQQILKMDTQLQQKSCNKGLVALNKLKQKY